MGMEFTGERFVPGDINIGITLEHWHRYFLAREYCSNKAILDIACGEGYGSAVLAGSACHAYGVDIDIEAIDQAKKKYVADNLEFLHGSIETIPLNDSCVDVVVSFETIEHVGADVQEMFLNEVLRVLKPDGLLIISTPDRYYYSDIKKADNEYHVKEFYHDQFHRFLSGSFRSVNYGYQNKVFASYIFSGNGCEMTQYAIEKNKAGVIEYQASDYEYIVAICSNSNKVKVKNSINIDMNNEAFRECFKLWDSMAAATAANLYVDTGQGFSEKNRIVINDPMEHKCLEFDIGGFETIKRLRFDPFNTSVIVKIESMEIIDRKGQVLSEIDFSQTNALLHEDNTFYFATSEPGFFIDLNENTAQRSVKLRVSATYLNVGNDAVMDLSAILLDRLHNKNLEVEIANNEIEAKGNLINQLEQIQSMLQQENAGLQQTISDLYQQISDQQQQYLLLEQHNLQVQEVITMMEESTSWKLTQPLRKVNSFFHRDE